MSLRELYLRKIDKKYFLYALGRNGECTLKNEAGQAQSNKVSVRLTLGSTTQEFV